MVKYIEAVYIECLTAIYTHVKHTQNQANVSFIMVNLIKQHKQPLGKAGKNKELLWQNEDYTQIYTLNVNA